MAASDNMRRALTRMQWVSKELPKVEDGTLVLLQEEGPNFGLPILRATANEDPILKDPTDVSQKLLQMAPEAIRGMEQAAWSPILWTLAHLRFFEMVRYPFQREEEHPHRLTKTTREKLCEFFQNIFPDLIPCVHCRAHWREYSHTMWDHTSTVGEAFAWIHRQHNMLNKKNGRRELDIDEALHRAMNFAVISNGIRGAQELAAKMAGKPSTAPDDATFVPQFDVPAGATPPALSPGAKLYLGQKTVEQYESGTEPPRVPNGAVAEFIRAGASPLAPVLGSTLAEVAVVVVLLASFAALVVLGTLLFSGSPVPRQLSVPELIAEIRTPG
jgi:hypothetical protein